MVVPRHDPSHTRVRPKPFLPCAGHSATLHAGQAQAQLEGHEPVYIPVGAFCPPLEKQLAMRWRMGVRNKRHTTPTSQRRLREACSACRIRNICSPGGELLAETSVPRAADHGTEEPEVYANPQRCPQISLIDGPERAGAMQTD